MNVGLDQSFTFILNPTNDVVERTTLETLRPGPRGAYIADVDGDGVPDKRDVKGEHKREVFYKGEFIESAVERGKRPIVVDGRKVPVSFTDGRWTSTEPDVVPAGDDADQ